MSDTTIDELRAGWEQVREKVKALLDENARLNKRPIGANEFDVVNERKKVAALERMCKIHAERSIQLTDENRELRARIATQLAEIFDAESRACKLDELLWWVTALAGRVEHDDIVRRVRQMLATQGYTRENLEKR